MTHKTIANPPDNTIQAFATEFAKIPNYHRDMQDPDLKKVYTFISFRVTELYSVKKFIVEGFLPKTDELIRKTENEIRRSKYRDIIESLDYKVTDQRFETIRLGYVMMFHKYEVFVKDLFKIFDEVSPGFDETKEPLEQFCKRKLNFNPKEWHRFPAVHKVNFISNCTKHHDGYCRLNNPKHPKPIDFIAHSENRKIYMSTELFKQDIEFFLDISLKLLLSILGMANMLCSMENTADDTYESNGVIYPLHNDEAKKVTNEQNAKNWKKE
ncbi:MAG: hypothetical protein BGO69_18800 [Bacteroidetes bacterium 46-16]|nr:MAG: hypothetical protein BGO69_18800 [Bacteroidetes bacterium 46-16]